MLLISVILYIVPQGRVAYWADWRLWGLIKSHWGNIHINLVLLFLIAVSLHIYYNWKPPISKLLDEYLFHRRADHLSDDFRGRDTLINELANQLIGLFSFYANHQSP